MELNSDSTIAELRNELDRKRRKAIDLQMNTTDPDEWAVLNSLRWELEDLDKDIYLGHFIKNNDKCIIDTIKLPELVSFYPCFFVAVK